MQPTAMPFVFWASSAVGLLVLTTGGYIMLATDKDRTFYRFCGFLVLLEGLLVAGIGLLGFH